MPDFLKGRGVRVEVAKTYGAPIAVTAVSKASPGVATAAAHGLTDGTVGYMSGVTGMVQLDGQAVRVDAPAAGSFTLQGLNTSAYSDYTGGNIIPVTAWETLAESDQYEIGGGSGSKLETSCLLDVITQEENGLLPTQGVTINIKATEAPSPAMALIETAAQSGGFTLFRVTLPKTGAVRVWRGEPSLPSESVGVGAVGTGSLSVAVKGFVLKLVA